MLRSALVAAFSAAVIFGALSGSAGTDSAKAGDSTWRTTNVTAAGVGDSTWIVTASDAPDDSTWVAPSDSTWVAES
ncbi:hypothetical protein [Streptomyces sp. NPDC088794]|jgi:hypothetical protein|uniref:hypothetical protein n=1 Tax=Streptomyces sp. NPDC088794 TaxID=3365902 RepID=UPI0037F9FB4B